MAAAATVEYHPDSSAKLKVVGGEALMDAAEDIVFGSIAGVAGKYIEYPFDTVKVRLQSQPDHQPLRYKGPLDCFRQSLRSEGLSGLYRGISAPLVGAALETSSLFFWERVGRESLFSAGLYQRDKPLPLSALWLTGAISGAFTSLILTPIELVKCKIQVPTTVSSDGMIHKAPTPMAVIREVFRHQGLRGFWHGQLGTLIRETGGCAAWFGSKETATMMFRTLNTKYPSLVQSPAENTPIVTSESSNDLAPLPLWQQAVAGASAGMSYNFLFFPADTIKSRMQTASVEDKGPRQRFWAVGVALYKQYGLQGLYRGCGITVARSAPSSAFIFIIFDGLKSHFHFV
ncbi:putative mitochondrial amino acid transporter ARG-13 [Coleophoma crateriformis]|uniref:Putative mitochondrial amino acid transporter ARG-13 n=1 Tax=Coleophoma crateriformis TaxID=565419 RepID=A0A3D8T9Q1_9HELO|nr:putative mitochondrial amino acid transporter ARG-13 [Coleophoma crateriformis]